MFRQDHSSRIQDTSRIQDSDQRCCEVENREGKAGEKRGLQIISKFS